MSIVASTSTHASGPRYWAFVPVVLLVASVAGVSSMATIAARDPGFSLEKDYYQQAIHWDGQQAQWAENERLGYRLGLELAPANGSLEVVLRVTNRAGEPLTDARVSVEAFASARAGVRRTLELTRAADGTYRTALDRARPGLWEFRVLVADGNGRYAETLRADVPGRLAP